MRDRRDPPLSVDQLMRPQCRLIRPDAENVVESWQWQTESLSSLYADLPLALKQQQHSIMGKATEKRIYLTRHAQAEHKYAYVLVRPPISQSH